MDEGSVTTDFQPDAGWGVSGWGDVPWGLENDVITVVTGSALATFVHPVDIQIDGNVFVNVDEDDDGNVASGHKINKTTGIDF